ncbi:MAG: class I SAM-dependent methyltransferase [Ktedonobacterales bacterium]
MRVIWIALLVLFAPLAAFFGLWSIAVPVLHRRAISRLFLKPGMRVADVGCGPGFVTVPLARRVGSEGEVVAYDVKPRMVSWTASRARKAGLANVRVVAAGAGEGKMERGYFDRAVLITVLGEMTDTRTALAEIFRALKPGGILSITESRPDPHFHSQADVRRLAEAAGFKEHAHFGNSFAFTMNLVRPG